MCELCGSVGDALEESMQHMRIQEVKVRTRGIYNSGGVGKSVAFSGYSSLVKLFHSTKLLALFRMSFSFCKRQVGCDGFLLPLGSGFIASCPAVATACLWLHALLHLPFSILTNR